MTTTAETATLGRRHIMEECRRLGYPEPWARVLQFYHYQHLPPDLAKISKAFHDLAFDLCSAVGSAQPAEMTVALRKLLEAKDAAVRASLPS